MNDLSPTPATATPSLRPEQGFFDPEAPRRLALSGWFSPVNEEEYESQSDEFVGFCALDPPPGHGGDLEALRRCEGWRAQGACADAEELMLEACFGVCDSHRNGGSKEGGERAGEGNEGNEGDGNGGSAPPGERDGSAAQAEGKGGAAAAVDEFDEFDEFDECEGWAKSGNGASYADPFVASELSECIVNPRFMLRFCRGACAREEKERRRAEREAQWRSELL